MGSSSHYQPLPTSSEDDQLRAENLPVLIYRKRRGVNWIRIIQILSLSLTASCLGWVGYHYTCGAFLLSPQAIAAKQIFLSPSQWDNQIEKSPSYVNHSRDSEPVVNLVSPRPFVNLEADAETVESKTNNIKSSTSNPTLPNPYLFGNFFDQLESIEKTRYVTAVPLGGINNQMIGTFNLMNLGRHSSRTVILPPITPNEHQSASIKGRSYSRYYDLPQLTAQTGIKLVEWNTLRNQVPELETGVYAWTKRHWQLASNPLTCWVASNMGGPKEDGGRSISTRFARGLMLDIQPQYAPGDLKKGSWRSMAAAVKFLETNSSTRSLGEVSKDVGCLTESYWLDSPTSTPDTHSLIKHLRFTDWLESIVDNLIARALGTSVEKIKSGQVKFITVHLRRNDIAAKCQPAPKNWETLAATEYNSDLHKRALSDFTPTEPLTSVARRSLAKRKADWTSCHFTDSYVISRVNAFRKKLKQPNIPVILTTDDTSVSSLALFDIQPNWHRFDLAKFSNDEVYDGFDSVMIDACLLTRGVGFLGTGVSTMSRLAANRGRFWYSRHAEIF
ncbi:hypothetical protein CROQUDRAFT_718675 [Cronartium quercuum f. sp. fusiforme G11]|uniref:O-fucosyltransferase family protein n=1 Tax=Cronartium quercuum f. sp. fusiforme G11 TaxID=708437 RepID=A0A9P6N9Z2_9BASI|nr:hypothetical protein CROQUDRAFT_718675 [Cronartium quercuum f. sp. fusiforme G11]